MQGTILVIAGTGKTGRWVPGAAALVGAFAELAVASGTRRLVLLSGRGEEGALLAEEAGRRSGAEWTIVRSTWFSQNFSEGFFLDQLLTGELALPAGAVREPFVDAEDIADVAAAALTEDREIRYVRIPLEEFASRLSRQGVPAELVTLMRYLFAEVLDGRNARALGRPARDFADYARAAAAAGVWAGAGARP